MVWVRAKDGLLFGVCAGLARSFGFDPWVFRLLLLLCIFIFGFGFVLYFLLALSLPREDKVLESREAKLLGVCYRLSRQLNIEVGLVRFLFLFFTITSFGITVFFYFLLHFLLKVPQDDIKN